MNDYIGVWVHPDTLGRELEVGDWVMLETLDDTLVIQVSQIDDEGTLWHFNKWIIPSLQIVAVKETVVEGETE